MSDGGRDPLRDASFVDWFGSASHEPEPEPPDPEYAAMDRENAEQAIAAGVERGEDWAVGDDA